MSQAIETARNVALGEGRGLNERQLLDLLRLPDENLDELMAVAHQVRRAWCGDEGEGEGNATPMTGGCQENSRVHSQPGQFNSPACAVWLNIPELIDAARETRAVGATEFCIVAAIRGPDERLMAQVRAAVKAIHAEVQINVACSLGILTQGQVNDLQDMGIHRYNHNLETAGSYFSNVVTSHTFEDRWETCEMVRQSGMELCSGGIVGMGESLRQRAELAVQLASLEPDEVALNFLDPRPGTPFGGMKAMGWHDALRTAAAFRLAMPRTILGFAGGRPLALGELGTRADLLDGVSGTIVSNYLTTLGRRADRDLDPLRHLRMPIQELQKTL